MLTQGESPQRRYYSRYQAILVGSIGVGFTIIMAAGLTSEFRVGRIFGGLSLVVMGGIGFRFIRSGIEVFDSGVRVRNIFSTLELPWQQIDKFEIGDSGFLSMVCLIRLKGGETRRAVGIQERTNFPSGSAEAIVEELNSELARRGPGRNLRPDGSDSQMR